MEILSNILFFEKIISLAQWIILRGHIQGFAHGKALICKSKSVDW